MTHKLTPAPYKVLAAHSHWLVLFEPGSADDAPVSFDRREMSNFRIVGIPK